MSEIVHYSVYFGIHLQVDNFHSVLHLLLNMVPPSVESMSLSSSTSKDENDIKNKSEEDDNIFEIILHQKDSKCAFLICIYCSPLEAFT